MAIETPRLRLEPITPALARRIVDRDERQADRWHPDYPFVDEVDPLRSLAASDTADPDFTMYLLRRKADGLAVGGFGFFGPPDDAGRVEFGYGLITSARGNGLATEAVRAALDFAAAKGVLFAAADTDSTNVASQRVLLKSGLAETHRDASLAYFERDLTLSV